MKRSKLKRYVDILKALTLRGSMKPAHIMYKANISHSMLQDSLDFLVNQGMVEARTFGKQRVVYSITQRGALVFKCFKKLEQQPQLRCLFQ